MGTWSKYGFIQRAKSFARSSLDQATSRADLEGVSVEVALRGNKYFIYASISKVLPCGTRVISFEQATMTGLMGW